MTSVCKIYKPLEWISVKYGVFILLLVFQTWDLLRLMYYGFTEFCKCFFERFPGYHIVPLRINGSAIETIFSQLRFSTSGNLSGSNYGYALSSLTLKRFLHGHQGKFKYRNARLYIRQKNIKRRRWLQTVKKCSLLLSVVCQVETWNATHVFLVEINSTYLSLTCIDCMYTKA